MPINPAMAQPVVVALKTCGEPWLQVGGILWISPEIREALPLQGRGGQYFISRCELRAKS
jgi:hypothetical protein